MRDTTKAIERIQIEICKLWEAIADINKHQSQVEPHAEPKQEPAKEQFKIGDWVETNKQHHVEITEFPAKHYNIESKVYECYNLSSNKRHLIEEREIVRKLDPSEIRVKITMEGTVSQDKILHGASCFTLKTGMSEYIISLHEIEECEMVESLLKAQEELCQ